MPDILKKYSITDILLLLTLITLPLPEHWNSKALLLIIVFVLYQFYKDFKIEFPKIAWVYIVFFVFSGISYIWSQDKQESIKAIVSLLPFLLFTIAYKQIFNFHSLDKIMRLTAIIFIFYGIIMLILAYLRFSKTHDLNTFYYHELTAPFGANAIYIALIFGLLYIFILYTILFSIDKPKVIDILIALLLFGFQILLSSKMILTVLIFISILFLLTYVRMIRIRKKNIWIGAALAIVFLTLFSISSFTKNRFKEIKDIDQINQVFNRDYFGPGYYWNGLTLRLFQLRCFYEIEEDPEFNSIIGTGFNASQPTLNARYAHYDLYRGPSGEGETDGYFVYNFHNQYAQLLVELGIFGGILIALILYFFVVYPIKQKNILLFGVAILFLWLAFTESYLLRQKGIVSFVLFPLLAISYFENKTNRSTQLR